MIVHESPIVLFLFLFSNHTISELSYSIPNHGLTCLPYLNCSICTGCNVMKLEALPSTPRWVLDAHPFVISVPSV